MFPLPKTQPVQPLLPVHDPSVRVDEDGLVFNREAAELIGISPSSRVVIVQEESNPINMYVQVVRTAGYPLHKKNKRLLLHSHSLARRILNNATVEGSKAVFRLGEPTHNITGERIVPIITRINYAERNKV